MKKTGDIENTGNREHKKLGEAKPIWPRDRRKGNSVRSFAIIVFDSLEYILCWFYYLVGHVADFSNAHLAGAIVTSANGAYSNFAGADLSNANFRDTELQGALFDGADIGGARLSQSYDLSDTQIEGACACVRHSADPAGTPGMDRDRRC